MKKLLTISLYTLLTLATASAEITQVAHSIAFIDTTEKSIQWLQENKDYLKNNKIPVMVIGASATDIKQLNTLFQGVLLGVEPEPKVYTKMLLKQLGVKNLPYINIQK